MHWDPDPVFWNVPLLGLPIAWYGVLFAVGFFVGYLLAKRMVAEAIGKTEATKYTDRLLIICVVGTVVGARLGHVFFYEWPLYREHLWWILNIRMGGLASHGAAVGVLLSLCIFYFLHRKKYPAITFLRLLDVVVVPTVLIGAFIRFGNFVNQELVGTVTSVPWAVTFGHPADGGAPVPRHPVQLYECFAYLITFVVMWALYAKVKRREGVTAGVFFVLVFGARFLLEYFKVPQSVMVSDASLFSMGQILSLPFLVIGVGLIVRGFVKEPLKN